MQVRRRDQVLVGRVRRDVPVGRGGVRGSGSARVLTCSSSTVAYWCGRRVQVCGASIPAASVTSCVGVDPGGGGGVDPGDEDGPEPVGGDPVDGLDAEDVLELGGPGGADPVRGRGGRVMVAPPRCGARRHHNAAAGFSAASPAAARPVSSAGTGRPAVSARVSRPARTGQ